MITAVGVALVGAGVMLVYAGVTGAKLSTELKAAFAGGKSSKAKP